MQATKKILNACCWIAYCCLLFQCRRLNCHLFIADHAYVSELGIELQTSLNPHEKMTPMMEPFRYYSYLLLSSSGDAATFTLSATFS